MFKQSLLRISLLLILFTFSIIHSNIAQNKKIMDESVYSIWNKISDTQISNDGDWIIYTQSPDQGDKTLKIFNTRKRSTKSFSRIDEPVFSADDAYVYFKIKPSKHQVKELKRSKTKPDEMPKDSLGVYNLKTQQLETIPNVGTYKSPEKWSGVIAYTLDPAMEKQDSTVIKKPRPKKKPKKGEKSEDLVIYNQQINQRDTVGKVSDFVFSEEGGSLVISSSGVDTTEIPGVYLYSHKLGVIEPIFRSKGKYSSLSLDKKGDQIAFLADLDTTEVQHRPYELYYWSNNILSKIADRSSGVVKDGWDISPDQKLLFSEDGKRLFFGSKPQEILQDTTLLEEEIVNVEVWSYTDGKLYTQQAAQADREKKKSYLSVYHIEDKKIFSLGNSNIPEISLNREGTSQFAIGLNDRPYQKFFSWEGVWYNDLYRVNVNTGEHKTIATKINARPRVSPAGNYFYWYSNPDSSWYTYQVSTEEISNITEKISVDFANELHDSPSLPRSYGIAGWTEDEDRLMIYDRYDIWAVDPKGKEEPKNLTKGRAGSVVNRVVNLDREEKYLPSDKLLINGFKEEDKSTTIGFIDLETMTFESVINEDFQFRRFLKAKNSDDLVYTKESFNLFPDLLHNKMDLSKEIKVSIANPQQKDYKWGSAELIHWKNLNGKQVEGLLFKPEDFDPKKKYPMIVNFYERSANRLNRHRAPEANRSTINYTFYVNNGYIVFNPDIIYEEGYPGKSCYDNVMPGVQELIKLGFIDENRIALQGHSWGGYQIADLLTKTDMFACAEAGAPVVNMTSAYGGIRWQTGLSRMFQYEKTQSRLGATLWERPDLYLENSPLFSLDKMATPVLIMHNDADGHVPWYQGIEYFVALRRLGKPAWMLNYNGEPHWPLKWQNRLDFNIRMKQFFDHYLKDAPAPRWMRESIPANEKGINLGYELGDAPRN